MDKLTQDNRSGYRRPTQGLRPFRTPESKPPDTGANVRASGCVMLIAFVLMALFNSSDLRSFTRDLPADWFTDQLVIAADQWHDLMIAWGPAHVRPAVRELFDDFRNMRW